MIRICIIGVSGFGAYHYLDIVREYGNGRCEPVAATIINPQQEQDKCEWLRQAGCAIYSDYRSMLADWSNRADLCMIPTGIPLHRSMTIAAVEAGMHVLVEKPAASAIQDVIAMQESAQRANRIVAVGFQSLYPPSTMSCKRALLNGQIGKVERITGWGLWPRHASYYKRNHWAARLKSGDFWVLDSPFNNALAHDLMQMLFFAGDSEFGAARPVSVEAELYRANPIECPDTAALRIQTNTGIPLLFLVSHATAAKTPGEIEIAGTRGSLHWDRSRVIIRKPGTEDIVFSTPQGDLLRAHLMDAVFKAVSGRDAFYCDLSMAGCHTLAVNGAHEATDVVPIPDKYVRVVENNHSTLCVAEGIAEAVLDGARQGKLFSELGVSWARPAGRFDLCDYQHFAGGKCGIA